MDLRFEQIIGNHARTPRVIVRSYDDQSCPTALSSELANSLDLLERVGALFLDSHDVFVGHAIAFQDARVVLVSWNEVDAVFLCPLENRG